MASAEMNIELSVGVTVREGDTLIVCWGQQVTHEQAADLKAVLMARLPGLADVVILNAASVSTYRPDPVERTVDIPPSKMFGERRS